MQASSIPAPPRQVYGIDFSGAIKAGKKIWIACGEFDGDRLRIEACFRAATLPEADASRDRSLAALRMFIGQAGYTAFGLDFPFSLPQHLIRADRWEDFTQSFAESYTNPDAFRHACRQACPGKELRRLTDRECRTPFSPYNLWLYKQTFFGIRDLLAPLVRDRAVCVLPMQRPRPNKPWLLEICPASTLKRAKVELSPYKGRKPEHCKSRARLLTWLEWTGVLVIAADARQEALCDHEGDALDSLIAAYATTLALRSPADLALEPGERTTLLEGRVYA